MRFGFILPGGTASEQFEQAVIAEQNGWDGIFVWEAAYGVDAWTLLAAMAQRTSRLKLGTMLTPLPWRRPWKVASQVATLDRLSGGRAILAVGLGAVDTALGQTGEVLDRRQRAEMLDEGIDLIRGFWDGQLRFAGQHYTVDLSSRADLAEVAIPVQPRIPIWVVAAWPRMKSMRRALRCDGLLPEPFGMELTPDIIRAIRAWLDDQGVGPDFDIIAEGETPPSSADSSPRWREAREGAGLGGEDRAGDVAEARRIVSPWADAGATWWLESRWELPHHSSERMRQVRERLESGPPR